MHVVRSSMIVGYAATFRTGNENAAIVCIVRGVETCSADADVIQCSVSDGAY